MIGATFPGLPAFPHFGHNGKVAWNITHTHADYQDLYVEQFDSGEPGRYRVPNGWADAERTEERIAVRDGAPVMIETWRTRHGPIVHGDPRRGPALSLRYTATDEPCRGFEALRPMLTANSVAELHEAQREWVDPVNNLVSADVHGNIGYLTRGYLPVRSSDAHRSLPAPGWTGEHEWVGRVPFEELPQAINPPEGFIATANQKVIPGDTPYISDSFAPPARAERIRGQLSAQPRLSPERIVALQGDVTSLPAQAWIRLLQRIGPFGDDSELARAMLASWDGALLPDSNAALLYAFFRRRIARALFETVVGGDVWRWHASATLPPTSAIISGWMANVIAGLAGRYADATPDGRGWDDVLPEVLSTAWAQAVAAAGPDPAAWRWAAVHRTNAYRTRLPACWRSRPLLRWTPRRWQSEATATASRQAPTVGTNRRRSTSPACRSTAKPSTLRTSPTRRSSSPAAFRACPAHRTPRISVNSGAGMSAFRCTTRKATSAARPSTC